MGSKQRPPVSEAQADRHIGRKDTWTPRKSGPGLKGKAGLPGGEERGEGMSPANPQHLGEQSSICGRPITAVFHFFGMFSPCQVLKGGPALRE